MKDAELPLRKAYKELLSGLTYNGKPVALYDLMASDKALAPYVILGPWQGQKDNTKLSFGQSGEINLDVFTRFTGDQRSTKMASDIANAITDLLKPTPTAEVLSVEGFDSWKTLIEGSQDISQVTGTDTIIRKIITVSHSLCQH